MVKGTSGGILSQLRQVFSSRSDEQNWEGFIEQIERTFADKQFDQLEKDLERAVDFLQERPEDGERPGRIHQLAEYYEQYAGNFRRSEELYHQAIDLCQKQAENDPLKAAPSLNSLAVLLIHQRRYTEAEPLLRRLLAIVEKGLGKDHPEYATCLENLAATLRHPDQEKEATEIRSQALLLRQAHRRKLQQ